MINIETVRRETPGCSQKLHFNNAGASLMPTPVIDAIQNQITLEAQSGGYEAADKVEEDAIGFYASAAKLLNAHPRNIAFTSSATNSYARALSCIPFEKGDKVLTSNEDYISNQLAFLSLSKRWGIELVRAASLPSGGVDVNDVERMMDKHRPKLVSLTHVPTNSGMIQPIADVGRLCRARGIPYLVDACQSVGQFPVDVAEIQCDFLSATMRKFLRGPRGTGFLYVSDEILQKKWEPLFIDMRGANWTADNEYTIRPDARRFEEWELPYALVLGGKAALDYALRIGLDEIKLRNAMLSQIVREKINALNGFRLLDIGVQQSSIITVAIENGQPMEWLNGLRKRNINTSISYREFALIDFNKKGVSWALRISPHYFNTENEIEQLITSLSELS